MAVLKGLACPSKPWRRREPSTFRVTRLRCATPDRQADSEKYKSHLGVVSAKRSEAGRRRMAGTKGLEPSTFRVTGGRSNQLSYAPILGLGLGLGYLNEQRNIANYQLRNITGALKH